MRPLASYYIPVSLPLLIYITWVFIASTSLYCCENSKHKECESCAIASEVIPKLVIQLSCIQEFVFLFSLFACVPLRVCLFTHRYTTQEKVLMFLI